MTCSVRVARRRGRGKKAAVRTVGLLAMMLSLAAAATGARAMATSSYSAVDLGALGGPHSMARALSENGRVVGWSYTADGPYHAFAWSDAGGMVDLGTLGGNSSEALAVNDNGQVAGWSETGSGDSHAFTWTEAGGIVDLGTLGGPASQATLLNNDGQVVGGSSTTDGFSHAFSWTQAGGMVDLGTLAGGSSGPADVNESGQVVGWSVSPSGQWRAFSWTEAGGMVDLGTLAGTCMCTTYSRAYAVTDEGEVFGVSTTAVGEHHAFSWTQAGGMTDLGNLGLTYGMEIQAVSDSGQFVGSTLVAGGHAFSWTQADGLVDLGTLGGLGSSAWAVNDSGQVVGTSDTTGNFGQHAFMWTQADGMIDLGTFGGTVSEARDVNEEGQIVGGSSTGGVWPSTHAVLWNPAGDATPPTITLPADIVVDATSPDGAPVTYAVTVTDDSDPSPTVTCSPPSGSVFAIGDTTVACTASDAAGNVASASFQVHVRGADEQVAELIALVGTYGLGKLGTSLHDKLVSVQRFLTAGKLQQAEDNLEAFIAQVDSQRGKGLTSDQADALESAARRILDVIVT